MSFCQFGLHDTTIRTGHLINVQVMNDIVGVCRRCYTYLQNKLVDPTISIFYSWSEQCGPSPPLPNTLKISCLKRVELVSYLDFKLNSDIRNMNPNFPVFLLDHTEKDGFTEKLKQDRSIESIISDINCSVDRKNITLRLWCGLKEAARTIRKNYSTGQRNNHGQIIKKDYTPHDRRRDFMNTVDPKANKDEIYAAGVEAAVYHELFKTRQNVLYLEGVPDTSKIWKYVKSKGRSIVDKSDLEEIS